MKYRDYIKVLCICWLYFDPVIAQMKAKMLVAHTEPVLVGDIYDWRVRSVR